MDRRFLSILAKVLALGRSLTGAARLVGRAVRNHQSRARQGALWLLVAAVVCGCGLSWGLPPWAPRGSPPGKFGLTNVYGFTSARGTNTLPPAWLKPPESPFQAGPGDVLAIAVGGEPDRRVSALVGPDGKMFYDLLPGLFVWGLTLEEIKALLETNLAKYLRARPDLEVVLEKAGSKHVWVLGSVQRPGVYPLATPMPLLEVLANAGGTVLPNSAQETADLKHSFVVRNRQRLPVDLEALLRRGDLSQNIYLQADDLIYVQTGVSPEVYVVGAVTRPNVVALAAETSLLSVIKEAGGPTQRACLSDVVIIRGPLQAPMIALVDYQGIAQGRAPDVRLKAGDIVYMPDDPVRKLELVAEQALNHFARAVALREGLSALVRER
jgi:protein involved in polysaccharide export with SLBB domain